MGSLPSWICTPYEEYHPYGTCAYRSGTSGMEVPEKRYRYTGKERDEETGFQENHWRYYAPWLGRWTGADPVRGVGSAYEYCGSRPIGAVDPSGLDYEVKVEPKKVTVNMTIVLDDPTKADLQEGARRSKELGLREERASWNRLQRAAAIMEAESGFDPTGFARAKELEKKAAQDAEAYAKQDDAYNAQQLVAGGSRPGDTSRIKHALERTWGAREWSVEDRPSGIVRQVQFKFNVLWRSEFEARVNAEEESLAKAGKPVPSRAELKEQLFPGFNTARVDSLANIQAPSHRRTALAYVQGSRDLVLSRHGIGMTAAVAHEGGHLMGLMNAIPGAHDPQSTFTGQFEGDFIRRYWSTIENKWVDEMVTHKSLMYERYQTGAEVSRSYVEDIVSDALGRFNRLLSLTSRSSGEFRDRQHQSVARFTISGSR